MARTNPVTGCTLVEVASDQLWSLGLQGKLWLSSGASENELITGQTSFAATTPTFLLSVPTGRVAMPLFANLAQTGSVAGGAIDVILEIDDVDRYSSGGTAKAAFSPMANKYPTLAALSTLRVGPTASAGYGQRIWAATVGQDVSSAEGAVNGLFWRPEVPYFLYGPASFLIFTYAGTTGPTFFWSIGWAEWTVNELFPNWG